MMMRLVCVYVLIVSQVNVVISECGKRKVNVKGLITRGYGAAPGEWPWHAAIFHLQANNVSAYKCGGSVIGEYFILTTAHCTRNIDRIEQLPEKISVQLGNIMLGEQSANMSNHVVSGISAHKKYNTSNFRNDIALLKLETKITFTDFIQPICLWSGHDSRIASVVGQIGTIVGWGWTERTNHAAHELQAANVPIVGEFECLNRNLYYFGKSIFEGSFCAGYLNGTSACNGDSGGGLFLNISNTWRIRGIISFAKEDYIKKGKCDTKELVGFVNVAYYIDWITLNMNYYTYNYTFTDKKSNDDYFSNLTIQEIIKGNPREAVDVFFKIKSRSFDKIIGKVYIEDIKNFQKILNFIEAFPRLEHELNAGIALFQIMNKNIILERQEAIQLLKILEVRSISGKFAMMPDRLRRTTLNVVSELRKHRISEKKCREYSEFKIDTNTRSIAEFPHMVSFHAKPNNESVAIRNLCSGFLISPNYVISSSSCFSGIELSRIIILLGDLNILKVVNGNDGVDGDIVGIEQVIKHPDFNKAPLSIEIGLIKLKEELNLTQDIRPACLWTSPTIPDVSLTLTAFAQEWFNTGHLIDYYEICWKREMRIAGYDECSKYFGTNEIPWNRTSQICVNNVSGLKINCQGSPAGPLQTKQSTHRGSIYSVIGICSFHKNFDGNVNLDEKIGFLRVSSYIDWIESIVWPL